MLYTYRTQEKAADRYQLWEKYRKTTSIILTALTAGAFLASLGGPVFRSRGEHSSGFRSGSVGHDAYIFGRIC